MYFEKRLPRGFHPPSLGDGWCLLSREGAIPPLAGPQLPGDTEVLTVWSGLKVNGENSPDQTEVGK